MQTTPELRTVWSVLSQASVNLRSLLQLFEAATASAALDSLQTERGCTQCCLADAPACTCPFPLVTAVVHGARSQGEGVLSASQSTCSTQHDCACSSQHGETSQDSSCV
jgi:hypothetical protein